MRHLSRKDGFFLRIPAPEGASDRLKTAAKKSSSPAHSFPGFSGGCM
jgi:hypothetical protein